MILPRDQAGQGGGSDRDALTTYLREIRAFPLLSREQEVTLARESRAGSADALDRLVRSNLRFVVSIARKYQDRGVSLGDLISEGNLGLIRAAEKYDESKDVKFISYAVWWIRQMILQALAEQGHAVRVPLSMASIANRIAREANGLRQQLGRDPTQHEIAVEMDMTDEAIASTMPIALSYVSLDAPVSGDTDGGLIDYVADDASPAPDGEVIGEGFRGSIEEALVRLRGREAMVLRMHFGFDGNEAMTLEAIGQQLGITRERVRQIKEKALSRLRKSDMAVILSAYRDR